MLTIAALAALVASAMAAPTAVPSLSIKFTGPKEVSKISDFVVSATVTNTGVEALKINPYDTILSPLEPNVFSIAHTETLGSPKWVGTHSKHLTDPEALEKAGVLITLAPGASYTATKTVPNAYDFSKIGPGVYELGLSKTFFKVLNGESKTFAWVDAKVESDTLTVDIKDAKAPTKEKRTITYSSCSSSRQSLIQNAASNAQKGVTAALNQMAGGTSSTYVTWFGTYTASRFSTVQSHYNNESGDFANLLYDCSCTDSGTYAYTYPDDPTTVYLCPVFWQTGSCGTDSRQGTLVHETSHFLNNGGTQDYAYGQTDAKSLAKSNPSEAVSNADNHEYFEEAIYTSCTS